MGAKKAGRVQAADGSRGAVNAVGEDAVHFGALPAKPLLQEWRQAPVALWQEFKTWFPRQKARLAVGLEALLNRIRTAVAGGMMGLSTAVPLPKWLYARLERDYFFSPRKVMGVKFKENPELNEKITVQAFQMAPGTKQLETLHSFYLPAKDGKPTFVFFHGRDTNLGHLEELFETAHKKGYGFFAYDYPGFGKSDGVPGEKLLKKSGAAACRFLAGDGYAGGYRVPYQDQILMGYSLGGGVASNVAKKFAKFAKDSASTKTKFNLNGNLGDQQNKPRGLVLVNTFTSIPDLFREMVKERPTWLTRHLDPKRISIRFDSKSALETVNFPVRVFGCPNDPTIPKRVVQQLAEAAGSHGRFREIQGKGHGIKRSQLQQIFDNLAEQERELVAPNPNVASSPAKV